MAIEYNYRNMKVLIVEDDPDMAKVLKAGLEAGSHTVDVAPDGADGSFLARSFDYDLILLDYSLPKKNGMAVLKELRSANKGTPVIFLSVTDDPYIKVEALNSGADDYVIKPVSFEELNARILAVSRRGKNLKGNILHVDDLAMNQETCEVKRNGEVILLTNKEYSLLEYFMRNPNQVLTRPLIMEHVWSADQDPFSNTVEAHIRNLRMKINTENNKKLIITVPGRGYILRGLPST